MHGTVTPIKGDPPAVPVVKHRTITLTNRAPIRIIEDQWPVIAEGKCGYDITGAPYGWEISIRVRREDKFTTMEPRHIIHAHYTSFDDNERDEDNQTVRVGHLLDGREALANLWKHILEVGDELRERIANEHMRKHVVHAVDGCFAKLPPHDGY
jgi:hypothetical protein